MSASNEHGSSARPRNTGLDVIRSAAIILVMLHHFRYLSGCPWWFKWFTLRAGIGVDLFFVLSGWLIGGQLLRRLATSRQTDLWRFWVRRWLRTLPAYFAVLVVMVALGKVGLDLLPKYATFTQNYLGGQMKWFVTWSLCIEEHFYLVLPLLVMGLGVLARVSRKAVVLVIVALICLSPVLRMLAYDGMRAHSYNDFLTNYYAPTHMRLEGLALGVALAALKEFKSGVWQWVERNGGVFLVVGLLVLVGSNWNPWATGWTGANNDRVLWYPAVMNFAMVSLGTALMIPYASRNDGTPPSLTARGVTWFAELAYALYLTNELARDITKVWFAKHSPGFWVELFVATVFSLGFALGVRELAEKPGLRWRDRLLATRK